MKKSLLIIPLCLLFGSCIPTLHVVQNGHQTILLSNANFNNLGTFSATIQKTNFKASMNNEQGLIEEVKKELLANAKSRGVTLSETRILTNISTDIVSNYMDVSITMCADIIEFIK